MNFAAGGKKLLCRLVVRRKSLLCFPIAAQSGVAMIASFITEFITLFC